MTLAGREAASSGSSRPRDSGARVNRLGRPPSGISIMARAADHQGPDWRDRRYGLHSPWARRGRGVVVSFWPRPEFQFQMEAFLISAGLVAVAEIGDKTQLLAVV